MAKSRRNDSGRNTSAACKISPFPRGGIAGKGEPLPVKSRLNSKFYPGNIKQSPPRCPIQVNPEIKGLFTFPRAMTGPREPDLRPCGAPTLRLLAAVWRAQLPATAGSDRPASGRLLRLRSRKLSGGERFRSTESPNRCCGRPALTARTGLRDSAICSTAGQAGKTASCTMPSPRRSGPKFPAASKISRRRSLGF